MKRTRNSNVTIRYVEPSPRLDIDTIRRNATRIETRRPCDAHDLAMPRTRDDATAEKRYNARQLAMGVVERTAPKRKRATTWDPPTLAMMRSAYVR